MQVCALQEYVNGLAMALVGLGSATDSPSPRLTVRIHFILQPQVMFVLLRAKQIETSSSVLVVVL